MAEFDTSKIKWRVWWNPQVGSGCGTFFYGCPSLEAARTLEDALAQYDLFQLEHHIKPDYSNAGGIQWHHPDITADPETSDEGWWDYEPEDFAAAIDEWQRRHPISQPVDVLLDRFLSRCGIGEGAMSFAFLLPKVSDQPPLQMQMPVALLLESLQHWANFVPSLGIEAGEVAAKIERSLKLSIKRMEEDNTLVADLSDIALLWLAYEIIHGRGDEHAPK